MTNLKSKKPNQVQGIDYDGMNQQEVADALGISRTAVQNNENEKIENETISREQIVLWAYEAGFPTNYARNEIARFETFARLLQKYLERDYK
jgi:transcriptional regulator with XRE-family HTH domain